MECCERAAAQRDSTAARQNGEGNLRHGLFVGASSALLITGRACDVIEQIRIFFFFLSGYLSHFRVKHERRHLLTKKMKQLDMFKRKQNSQEESARRVGDSCLRSQIDDGVFTNTCAICYKNAM